MTTASLHAHHLAKSYKDKKVVENISIEVDEAQIVGLLGPNGAGKTTSFYMIAGILAADRGKITMNGEDITCLPVHQRAVRGLGYLPQEASIFRKLSTEDNIKAILEIRTDLSRQQKKQKLEMLLEEFHIAHVRHTLGMSLSGGERRRVEIARCLAIEPSFILLDEPFAGVDPISVNDIKKIIKHLQKRGIGILITDHNVRETLDICEQAYIVSQGLIIAQGTPTEIIDNPQVRKVYLGDQFEL